MFRGLDACHASLVLTLRSTATAISTSGDWAAYFAERLRGGCFDLVYHMPGDQYCMLVVATILNLALFDHRDDPGMAAVYLRNLRRALSTSAFVDRWTISIQIVCSTTVYGGYGAYKRECPRTEKALNMLKFAVTSGEHTVEKFLNVMLGWLFMDDDASVVVDLEK
jgi:hypothetical protein